MADFPDRKKMSADPKLAATWHSQMRAIQHNQSGEGNRVADWRREARQTWMGAAVIRQACSASSHRFRNHRETKRRQTVFHTASGWAQSSRGRIVVRVQNSRDIQNTLLLSVSAVILPKRRQHFRRRSPKLFNQRCQLSRCDCLESLLCEFAYTFPVNTLQIKADGNPPS